MKTDLKLQTGDKVSWELNSYRSVEMTGCVLEDFGDGTVDILSHTNNGAPCVVILTIDKSKLKII